MVVETIDRMTHPGVSIIIVNWNGKDYLDDCLFSVFKQTYPKYNVILVDNGSTDGSVEFAKGKYPYVNIIELDKNYGFAKANNIGTEEALKDENVRYIALLNNDTKVDRNWLSELVKVAESDKSVGICASKILIMDNPSIIDSTGYTFSFGRVVDRGHGEKDEGQYDSKLDVVGACGASVLYKREMLAETGLFDEDFFAYYEDAELSWRAYRNGWKARYVPTSIVYHKGGGTSKRSKEFEREMGFLCARNWERTVKRHATPTQKFLFILALARTAIMSWIGMRIGRNVIGAEPYINAFNEFFGIKREEGGEK